MARSPRKLVRFWDRQAPNYDARTSRIERKLLMHNRRWVCGRARGSTLEVAIGTGANLPYYPAGVELTGVDWSSAMVAAAESRATRSGRTIALQRADAAQLPFPSESFDSVVATFALCCVPDERAVLVEALRVLRPGGELLLADHVAASFWPLRALQHVVNLVSVPAVNEHYTRRPLKVLRSLEADIVATERLTMGAIERVHARKRR